MTTAIVFDPIYLTHDIWGHLESPLRLQVIQEALERREVRAGMIALAPRVAEVTDLERVHTREMIERVARAFERGETVLDVDTAICAGSYDVARFAAGGALAGVDALVSGQASSVFVACRPPGHHATPVRPMGFCLFNNAAVAARYAQAVHGVGRVLILDWDVHHGNGTQDAFYRDPTVYYISWHQMPLYPGTGAPGERGEGPGEGFTRNVPVAPYTPASIYRARFREVLEEVTRDFHPELIVLSAGFDGHAQDPLGSLMLEDSDYREMTLEVVGIAQRYAGGRLLSVLEGGYNLDVLGDSVATHVEALKEG